MVEKKIKNSVVRLVKGDITALEVEAFVYNSRPDLMIGSGYGTAISLRGGPSIQQELKALAPIGVGEAVITSAGGMKAKFIIHVVGPRFQEQNTEDKLRKTTQSALALADKKGIRQLALPPISSGFYGVPLDLCSRVMIDVIKKYLEGKTNIAEVVLCSLDNREFGPFKAALESLN